MDRTPPPSTPPPATPDTGFTVGDIAPNLIAYDQDDHAAPLYRFAQQALLLDFCTAWCGLCQLMAPSVTPITEALRNAGIAFTYLPVLLQNYRFLPATADDAGAWARRYGITTPVLQPRGAPDAEAWQQFLEYAASANPGVVGFPTLVFLDPDHRIQKLNAGFMSADDIQHQFDPNLPFLADAAAP
jgi:thiol-disulfide isomerase/thioredoxin